MCHAHIKLAYLCSLLFDTHTHTEGKSSSLHVKYFCNINIRDYRSGSRFSIDDVITSTGGNDKNFTLSSIHRILEENPPIYSTHLSKQKKKMRV